MPDIKYTGVPTVTPEEARRTAEIPGYNLKYPEVNLSEGRGKALAAIGRGQEVLGNSMATVGAAIHTLGKTLDGAGNELYSRAEGLQRLQQESNADAATISWTLDQIKRDDEFHRKKEVAANSDALAAHLKSSEDARQAARANLGSDLERKLFDQETRRTFINSARVAGSHSSNETIQHNINTQGAKLDLLKNRMVQATEDADFEDMRNEGAKIFDKLTYIHGWGEDERNQSYASWATAALVGRAQRLMITDPPGALRMLEANKDAIKLVDEKIYTQVYKQIKAEDQRIGARTTADAAYADDPDASLEDIENKAKKLAEERRPGDIVFRDMTIERVKAIHSIEEGKRRDNEIRASDTLTQALNGLIPVQEGQKPQKWEEVEAVPGVKEALATLRNKPALIDRAHRIIQDNAFGDRWADTPQAEQRGRDLKGMYLAGDRRFLDVKLEDEMLPRDKAHWGKNQLILDQMKMRRESANLQENPHVKKAIDAMRAAGIGIDRSYAPGSSKLNQLRAATWEALQFELRENRGKELSEKDYVEMGRRLLAKPEGWFQHEGFRTMMGGPTKRFKQDHPGMDDKEVQQLWQKSELMRLLKKEETKPTGPKITIVPTKPAQ